MKHLLLLALAVAAVPLAKAQTVLAAGDIAIVGMYTDAPDGFAFVALAPIANTTVIRFTDNGWLAAGGFRTGENVITWTATSAVTPGTVVTFTCPDGVGVTCSATVGTVANVTANTLNGLSSAGDQILAYQGTELAPVFVYALNNEGAAVWQADATTANTSALPAGLVNGVSAVALNELDNYAYTGPTAGTPGQLRGSIGTPSNWTGDDAIQPAFAGAFNVNNGEPVETATVSFVPTSATVAEGGASATTVVLTILGDSGPPGLNAPVSGSIIIPAARAADITSFTGAFGFPVGAPSGASRPVSIQTFDDAVFEGTETVPFSFDAVTGASSGGPFTLTITDNEAPPPAPPVVINEVDSDTPGTDVAEFVEILGPPSTSLSGLVLVFFNGSGAVSYLTVDLVGQTTNAAGRFVVCDQPANVPGCTLDLAGTAAAGFMQNGEDGVALYTSTAASFPNGTAATTTNLVDAVVYGTADPLASGLLTGLGLPVTYQFEENYDGAQATQSLARLNIPGVGPSALLYVQTPTPGAANAATVTVNETAGVDNVAGWRLLGVPVLRPTGVPFQVANLAPVNLVQGIPAGSANPAQYPLAPGPNLLTTYTGSGTTAGLLRPSSTDVGVPPAAGFFWYFYDQAIPAANIPATFGPGTGGSFELTDPVFQLSLTGIGVDDRLSAGPYSATVPVNADGAYMAANPFAYPVLLSALQASAGTISTNFSVYNPASGYALLTASDAVAPWQGVFVEVTGAPAGTVTLSASSRNVVPTSAVALVGRPAGGEARLDLRLDGVLASGEAVADYALAVRVLADATTGWDRHDGSKAPSPQVRQATAAFVGVRGGAERLQSALSLPADLGAPATLPLAFAATGAGSFSFSWDAAALPADWQAQLRDLETGETVNLRTADTYAFTAAATARADRFALVVGRGAIATEAAPETVAVGMPYPNPATDRASLTLRADRAQRVTAVVVDALGRTVATLLDADVAAGQTLTLAVATARLAPGLYVVRVQGETFAESRRLVVAR